MTRSYARMTATPLRHANADIHEDAFNEARVIALARFCNLDDFAGEGVSQRLRHARQMQTSDDFVVDRAEEGNVLWVEG
jgi:hypothetical protein